MVTLTVRHSNGERLDLLLDAVMKSWQRGIVAGRAWKDDKASFGITGYVRAVEITYGHANGWHPHIHALLFLDAEPSPAGLAALEERLYARWVRATGRYGAGTPTRTHGVDCQLVAHGAEAAQYVAKVQDGDGRSRSAAAELARGDMKAGRHGERFLPFELLDVTQDGEGWAAVRWAEYEKATSGRRCITWSVGLRDLLALGDEATDEELAEEDVGGEVVTTIDGEDWKAMCKQPWLLVVVLDAVEDYGAEGVDRVLGRTNGFGRGGSPP